jgi:cation transport ATPase
MADPPPADNLAALLARPLEQRKREQQYRFAQSVVFGLPVIALQLWGNRLGPLDAQRWGSVMQMLLAGWVMYVNLGMIFEGALFLRRRLAADFLVATLALGVFLFSAVSVMHIFFTGMLWYRPLLFWLEVTLLAAWTGFSWWRLGRIVARCA